jgi:hypothetical protein
MNPATLMCPVQHEPWGRYGFAGKSNSHRPVIGHSAYPAVCTHCKTDIIYACVEPEYETMAWIKAMVIHEWP